MKPNKVFGYYEQRIFKRSKLQVFYDEQTSMKLFQYSVKSHTTCLFLPYPFLPLLSPFLGDFSFLSDSINSTSNKYLGWNKRKNGFLVNLNILQKKNQSRQLK
jgi:hypothetical protein